MFTGIIQHTGVFERRNSRVTIQSEMDLEDVFAGDSIAINGVCLTTLQSKALIFDLGPETLSITTLGQLKPGSWVHLEKAMRLSDRLGGHFVQGHIDGIGQVFSLKYETDSLYITFQASPAILKLCVPQGSITIDGISLTICQLTSQTFTVCLIPHTLEKTNFKKLQPGEQVNLENDLIGKHVAMLFQNGGAGRDRTDGL